jgi:hypothetical protein
MAVQLATNRAAFAVLYPKLAPDFPYQRPSAACPEVRTACVGGQVAAEWMA